MARTASLTQYQAETLIGPADQLTAVTSDNRANLRKWTTAIGMPSEQGYRMSNVELMNLYATNAHWQTASQRSNAGTTAVPPPMPTRRDEAADALAEALRLLIGNPTAIVDENKVREIVADQIAKIEPRATVTRLEVSGPAGINVIEGTVHASTGLVIRLVSLGHAVMLVGPAGCGKTVIGGHAAQALGLPLYITSTVFDTHELMGFTDGMGNYHSTPFRQAFEHGGVWIADEVDAWDAAALLAANSALANGYASFPDSTTPIVRHANFRMVATANTFGHGADRLYVGRNELDAATLDRFATLDIDYDPVLEFALSNGNVDWYDRVIEIRQNVRRKNIRHVVSTRAIIMGSQALAAGIDHKTVESVYVIKGMSKTDREKIGL